MFQLPCGTPISGLSNLPEHHAHRARRVGGMSTFARKLEPTSVLALRSRRAVGLRRHSCSGPASSRQECACSLRHRAGLCPGALRHWAVRLGPCWDRPASSGRVHDKEAFGPVRQLSKNHTARTDQSRPAGEVLVHGRTGLSRHRQVASIRKQPLGISKNTATPPVEAASPVLLADPPGTIKPWSRWRQHQVGF